jgi:fructose-1,6-bisphosphatase/inositol monophosphatase family enzyme
MTMHPFHASVFALMRDVAATTVMPRFRTLAAEEIIEKTPGDLVTVADREAELRLSEGLARVEANRIVGEEMTAADPTLVDGIGEGRLWIVDPIDGTANFAAGQSPFGLMIALVQDGAVEAGWLYDPVLNRLCHAHRGHGAFVDGERITARTTGGDRPIAALATWFMEAGDRAETEARAGAVYDLVPIPRCAAEQYPRLCLGTNDVSLFKRTLPWDHAPGTLFLSEAGGRVSRWDGSDYRLGDGKLGLLATSSPALWDKAAQVLLV